MTDNPDKVTLRDIYNAVGGLRREVNSRVNKLDTRLNKVEAKTDNLLGKVGIGVMMVSAVFSSGVALIFNLFRKD